MIWNQHYECMSREDMKKVQDERLRQTVERVYYNVEFYRRKMQALGLEPYDIQGIEDLPKLPFTTKDDLRDNYPFGLFATPMENVMRIHASSGTTGKATIVGYTRHDVDIFSEVVARSLSAAGVGKNDILQNAYGYGLFTGGLGIHYGAEKLGVTVVPISAGNTKKQVQFLMDFGTTAMSLTPSYALYLAETLEEMGVDPKNLKLKVGIFGAEPWTESMRREIEKRLQIKAIDIYGLSEIIGPGVSIECMEQNGLHIAEDHFFPEIIDPATKEPLPPGEEGELVFTTLTKEALPLIRYRTRDLTTLDYQPCNCGRTTVRMKKCTGRSDDMLIIRGVNVFPSQVESVLLELNATSPHYLLIVDRVNNLDTLEVLVEVDEQIFSDEIKGLEHLTRKITQALESTLNIAVKVKLVEPQTIARSEGKATRVIDKRKLKEDHS
ncbi:phenylacetate--CoA ligase [Alkalibacter rhizosphaerae]|uniref:Phenylacetate-coenzyme A ligase n=1 Tax=Alkalibacter rhizosphaerae TaxID=2815577 RepID=A0A975AJ09_9FIRM|nr:phenylacetate--CoA ligase [Alkalibacter rhizosphaerae]QSX09085.1 phenylacetate--CoA ligase [Alkalibacter rhizosphaerae]